MPEDAQDNSSLNLPISDEPPQHESSVSADSQPQPVASPAHATIPPKNSKKIGLFAAIIAGILVLLGGSAAAYYAVVVPSKPENVLKTAVGNTLAQTKIKFDGKISYDSLDDNAAVKAVNVSFNGAADTAANAFQSALEITASGIKVPIEIRSLDKSLFFKVGDLGNIKGIAQMASPEYGAIADTINKKISNQWIEVDETLVKQAKADCLVNTSLALTKEDVQLLQKRYEEMPFANVKKITDDKINGHSAIKYEIELDGTKEAEYSKGLDGLSLVKKLKQCNTKQTSANTRASATASNIPLTLWVDKTSKQIVKLAGTATQTAEQKNKFKATYEITMQYGQATITKPTGAKPFMEVFGNIAQLFSVNKNPPNPKTSSLNMLTTPNLTNVEGVSSECLKAIQEYANSNGTKPVPASCL